MRNGHDTGNKVPLLAISLTLVLTATGAVAQDAGDDGVASPPVQADVSAEAKKMIASFSDNNLSDELDKVEVAIEKFKVIGVGVAPFEQEAQDIHVLLGKGEQTMADAKLARLKQSLADQQKRFYANKIQDWHKQRRLAAKYPQSYTPTNAAGALSKGTHSALSKAKGEYTPLIYPIAR